MNGLGGRDVGFIPLASSVYSRTMSGGQGFEITRPALFGSFTGLMLLLTAHILSREAENLWSACSRVECAEAYDENQKRRNSVNG